MAFDAFIKIDGVPGESTDDKHKDWIEILSYNLGMDQPSSATDSSAGGGTTERVNIEDFKVVKQVLRRHRDGGDGVLERLSVMPCGGAESTDLPDVLKRGGPHVGVGHLLGIGLAESLDAAAHASDVTPGSVVPRPERRQLVCRFPSKKQQRCQSARNPVYGEGGRGPGVSGRLR